MDETIIKIENAALKLKKFMIKPANLEIPKGYIVGVQGENGAGKTTLLHMMLGMYDKMKGKIYIDGLDVVKNKTKVKELVGIVSQDRKFYLSQDANGNEKIYSPFYKNWDSEEYHRMLAHLLLMDEPTANLDPVFRDDFLKLLQEFVAEYEMTILFATHLDDDLSRVADYVIDVKNGEYSMREVLE